MPEKHGGARTVPGPPGYGQDVAPGGGVCPFGHAVGCNVPCGDGRGGFAAAGVVVVVLDMQPLVPETVGQPVCVGSTEDGGAEAGVKLLALGIAGVLPGERFCGA